VQITTNGTEVDLWVAAGTATATFEGAASASIYDAGTGAAAIGGAGMSFIATVTAAGTLVFEAIMSSAGGAVVRNTSVVGSHANACGYTALKLA
jgi:hypothetical protein